MKLSRILGCAIAPALLGAALGCSDSGSEQASETTASSHVSFDAYESTLSRDPNTGAYILADGTRIVGQDKLYEYYAANVQEGALLMRTVAGARDRWSDERKVQLTYCVSTNFGNRYNDVVQAMEAATGAWEQAADVNFTHVVAQDANCTSGNNQVEFNVTFSEQPPPELAGRAAGSFFPSYARQFRQLQIFGLMWTQDSSWTLTGYLRHELGHALGFTDGQFASPRPNDPDFCKNVNNLEFDELTAFDNASVMQYPQCGGILYVDATLTDLDREGAARVYGFPPAASCAEMKRLHPTAGNNYYTLLWRGRRVSVTCFGMDAGEVPTAYITLPRTGETTNFSSYGAGNNTSNIGLTTYFRRLKFLPESSAIDVTDTYFSTSIGWKSFGNNTYWTNNYAAAGDCVGLNSRTGTANVDLRGTELAVVRNQFTNQGWYPAGSAVYSENDQVVSLQGGGYCGYTTVVGTELRVAPVAR